MSNENITNCIAVDENGKVINLVVGLDYTRNSTCVDMTQEFIDQGVSVGDTITGKRIPLDSDAGRLHNLFTILNPKLVKKPLTPEELRQKWYLEKRELENELKDIKFDIIYSVSRIQMLVMLGDSVSKDKELAKYQVLQAKETDLENRLHELLTNEPQG